MNASHLANATYVTLEPVQSQQSQNYVSQQLGDTEYHEQSPTYVSQADSYLYRHSESQENYTFYNKEAIPDNDNYAHVIYMKSANLPSEKLYNSVLSNAYEENHSQQNEQVTICLAYFCLLLFYFSKYL